MIVIGMDLSLTSSGFAVATNGTITSSGIIPGKHVGIERLIWVRNRVCEKIDATKPDLIVFEDLAFSRNEAYAKEVAGAAWMIRAELFTDKKPYLLVGASQLKKFTTGHGNSKKEEMLLACFKRWGHDKRSNDEVDALALAHMGMAILGDEEPTIEPQREVLAAVKTKNAWLTTLTSIPLQSAGGLTETVDAGW